MTEPATHEARLREIEASIGALVAMVRDGHGGGTAEIEAADHLRKLLTAQAADLEQMREFIDWLVSMDDPEDVQGREARRTVTLTKIIDRARALAAVPDPEGPSGKVWGPERMRHDPEKSRG